MNEIFKIVGPCVLFAAVVMIGCYWVCRWLDYRYTMKENRADYRHDFDMMSVADTIEHHRMREYQDRQYQYQKQLVQTATDRTKVLAMDVVKAINDSRYAQAKQMMGDVGSMTREFMKAFEDDD